MASKKKQRAEARYFSVPMVDRPTPEMGLEHRCLCGNRWWASDASWSGCRDCHSMDDSETSPLSHKDALEQKLYCVVTGGDGFCVNENGNEVAKANRHYPEGWLKP